MRTMTTTGFGPNPHSAGWITRLVAAIESRYRAWLYARAERAMLRLAMSDPRIAQEIGLARTRAEWNQ